MALQGVVFYDRLVLIILSNFILYIMNFPIYFVISRTNFGLAGQKQIFFLGSGFSYERLVERQENL